ncbi:MAG: hypothetical protein HQK65_14695 [Desulfamplus sp.]|nr:hypothetical protein [Desulfamplus sp.]
MLQLRDIERQEQALLKHLSDLYVFGTVPSIIINESGEAEYRSKWKNDELEKAYNTGHEFLGLLKIEKRKGQPITGPAP